MSIFPGSHNIEVLVASGEQSLAVVHFMVREDICSTFVIELAVRTPDDNLDLESIAGQPAALRVAAGRTWTGICSEIELVEVEETGLSTYRLRIVPALWLLTQRRRCRIFQHESALEIVRAVLAEWAIEPILRVDEAAYPKLDYRTQYNELDHDFFRRILAEAGISFYFTFDGAESRLVLDDTPGSAELRAVMPILGFVDPLSPESRQPYATHVRLIEAIRPDRYTRSGHDFRRPDHGVLAGAASEASPHGGRLEHYRYEPASFMIETAPDDVRADEPTGAEGAARRLRALAAGGSAVLFETNLLDLAVGDVVAVDRHPNPALSPATRLCVISTSLAGAPEGEWSFSAAAVPGSAPYCPSIEEYRKPRVAGVQSGTVVGPEGEEIHVDEFGRVRVQFRWDRAGSSPEAPSSWLRVSQGFAGAGFGAVHLPRVGHEVLVGFLDGDPDQPIVIGRAHNAASREAYPLPEQRTKSFWRSATTPGGGGFNEIMMEDAAEKELLYLHSQRDLRKRVGRDELERTAGDRTALVEGDLTIEVAGNVVIRSEADVVIKGGPHVTINERS